MFSNLWLNIWDTDMERFLLQSPVFQFWCSFEGEAILVDEVGVASVLPQPGLPLLKLGAQLLRSSRLLDQKKCHPEQTSPRGNSPWRSASTHSPPDPARWHIRPTRSPSRSSRCPSIRCPNTRCPTLPPAYVVAWTALAAVGFVLRTRFTLQCSGVFTSWSLANLDLQNICIFLKFLYIEKVWIFYQAQCGTEDRMY